MDTKLKKIIDKCKLTTPLGCCEKCGCNERQCLDALLYELTVSRTEDENNKYAMQDN